ncbi:YtoQ family protein [bacterium]|nr:YtoQ family protein [bacterium]
MELKVYLSGEIHSEWRQEIIDGIRSHQLPVEILMPVTDHAASDDVGELILGAEDSPFWRDHKAAKINSLRIKTFIDKADIVVVKFGEKYKQWNAAFDAGYAVAKGKHLITLHSPDLTHPLKEIDASSLAVAERTAQVVEILQYVLMKNSNSVSA